VRKSERDGKKEKESLIRVRIWIESRAIDRILSQIDNAVFGYYGGTAIGSSYFQ
jgi:hypothetical protein